jgi:uncharacterized secreted protein with C-terminal beta-propeller domain
MRTSRSRSLIAGIAFATGLGLVTGCTAGSSAARLRDGAAPLAGLRLVAFNSCEDALARLKQAAKESVGPYGFGGDVLFAAGRAEQAAAPEQAKVADAAGAPGAGPAAPNYSGTNTHEAGVDEPDLVKTDGRRIVTVNRGVLHVVDPAARAVTGTLDLARDERDPVRWTGADLLLHGDRALVLLRQADVMPASGGIAGPAAAPDAPMAVAPVPQSAQPRLLLVDLSGRPRIVSEFRVDGGLIDARQVGGTARVVIRSQPRIDFPSQRSGTDAQRIANNRAVIDRSELDDWLPRYTVITDARTHTGRVACDRLSRPSTYSGATMLTVFSFDLDAPALTDGDPVSVIADGDTVYSDGASLYISNDQRWRVMPMRGRGDVLKPTEPVTEIYKFDTSRPGRPVYAAAGTVKGWLINQYAMSEWDGHLRVATTTSGPWETTAKASSAVVVLRESGGRLVEVGKVGGLGRGERIYAVRFDGPTGYVVTFRQTDPLYTLDLGDPRAPAVEGELKITGYSAYLHPLGGDRLIGVGQEATGRGRIQGVQVSLFDVSALDAPRRLARFHIDGGWSEAEQDPHAFLWWAPDRLLVIPVAGYRGIVEGDVGRTPSAPTAGVLLLRVGDDSLTEVGLVGHPSTTVSRVVGDVAVRRSLVVDDALWTVSQAGLKATSLSTLDTLAWLPLG